MQFKDKVAVVTGAASGIGKAISTMFSNEGAKLVLADINKDGLAAFEKGLKDRGTEAIGVYTDVTKLDMVKALLKAALDRFGKIDIMCNNAGIILPDDIDKASYDSIDRQIHINLYGVIYGTKEVIPIMKKQGFGHIVNTASLGGIVPEPGSAVYSATKFAIRGFDLAVRLELLGSPVGISTVCPDSTETPQLQYEAEHGGSAMSFLDKIQPPEAVAKAVAKAILKNKIEVYVPHSQGMLARLGLSLPWLLPPLWPMLEKSGAKNLERRLRTQGRK
ncbi:MAG: SDR family oxidoreductase [Deltaproteobacteria bacterium]|nr:SDR family oxidoreductase [Deltaproteobacteria bacterium]MCL5276984.1 SDR family oxidoreductase [Deltaproteobacteria bacterium]